MSTAATERAATSASSAPSGGKVKKAGSMRHVQLTTRGVGSLALGIAVAVIGVGFATPILVYVGVAMTCAVAVGWLWVLVTASSFNRTHTSVHREVLPLPLTAGRSGTVAVSISAGGHGRIAQLRRTATEHADLREQAAAELTDGVDTKAAVERVDGTLTLRYRLHPNRRGRWPLGPALVLSADPFGMFSTDEPVGHPQQVPVWPATVDLSGTAGALMGHADRVVLGSRTPSSDDSSLRDYREGDDLRRVHWPSTARRGTMLVRSDERAGRRPATVILDLPGQASALERAISAAASVALSVLESGHPVRLVGADLDDESIRHLGDQGRESARYDLLNQTVDLTSPPSREVAAENLVRAARLVTDDARHGEVTVAFIDPLTEDSLAALVPFGESGRAWAIVRTDSQVEEQARESVTNLRRAGWHATTMSAADDLAEVWERMLSAGDIG